MRFLLAFLLALTGCVAEVDQYQEVLDQYAIRAERGDLSDLLTGSALYHANQSRDLLSELGLNQRGNSVFFETKLVADRAVLSCLDVSGVEFYDSAGQRVVPARDRERLLMSIEFSDSLPPKITQIQEAGNC